MSTEEQIKKQMAEFVVGTLEAPRSEFSGFPVCPFVKADRVADQLLLMVFDNEKETLVDIIKQFIKSGKRSALIAQMNEEIGQHETKEYQKFINLLLSEAGLSDVRCVCFNPKDDLDIEGFNARSSAPCFLINLSYKKHLVRAHNALKKTTYYDKMPEKYINYLGIKTQNKTKGTQ